MQKPNKVPSCWASPLLECMKKGRRIVFSRYFVMPETLKPRISELESLNSCSFRHNYNPLQYMKQHWARGRSELPLIYTMNAATAHERVFTRRWNPGYCSHYHCLRQSTPLPPSGSLEISPYPWRSQSVHMTHRSYQVWYGNVVCPPMTSRVNTKRVNTVLLVHTN